MARKASAAAAATEGDQPPETDDDAQKGTGSDMSVERPDPQRLNQALFDIETQLRDSGAFRIIIDINLQRLTPAKLTVWNEQMPLLNHAFGRITGEVQDRVRDAYLAGDVEGGPSE